MSDPTALDDASLVEPAALIGHFLAHPPEGFAARVLPGGDVHLVAVAEFQELAEVVGAALAHADEPHGDAFVRAVGGAAQEDARARRRAGGCQKRPS